MGRLLDGFSFLRRHKKPPLDLDQDGPKMRLVQGPKSTRLAFLIRILGEAFVYGLGAGAVVSLLVVLGGLRLSRSGADPMPEVIGMGLPSGLYLGLAIWGFCYPVLLIMQREQLRWSRLVIDNSGIKGTVGRWFGSRTRTSITDEEIDESQPRVTLTANLEMTGDDQRVDLTLETEHDFWTFATGLRRHKATRFALGVNHLLAGRGSEAAAAQIQYAREERSI